MMQLREDMELETEASKVCYACARYVRSKIDVFILFISSCNASDGGFIVILLQSPRRTH